MKSVKLLLALSIFRKKDNVPLITIILNKSKNLVMKWSLCGKTGEFSEEVFTGSHFNNSISADNRKYHDCIMMSKLKPTVPPTSKGQ